MAAVIASVSGLRWPNTRISLFLLLTFLIDEKVSFFTLAERKSDLVKYKPNQQSNSFDSDLNWDIVNQAEVKNYLLFNRNFEIDGKNLLTNVFIFSMILSIKHRCIHFISFHVLFIRINDPFFFRMFNYPKSKKKKPTITTSVHHYIKEEKKNQVE